MLLTKNKFVCLFLTRSLCVSVVYAQESGKEKTNLENQVKKLTPEKQEASDKVNALDKENSGLSDKVSLLGQKKEEGSVTWCLQKLRAGLKPGKKFCTNCGAKIE